MYDTLLFFHVLAAFLLVAAVVMFSAYTLGAPTTRSGFTLASRLEDIGGVGVLVLGIWLALYVDGYSLGDGWIIAAIVLWLAAGASGNFYRQAMEPAMTAGGAVAQRAATLNWVRAALTVLLLADMIWKPGA
ncbi:MAG TPA: hypothetical protein VHF58_09365 [Solirubrobacterales bacterium]|nr:hypothetical protein [Solirubrobacterales bacterium]